MNRPTPSAMAVEPQTAWNGIETDEQQQEEQIIDFDPSQEEDSRRAGDNNGNNWEDGDDDTVTIIDPIIPSNDYIHLRQLRDRSHRWTLRERQWVEWNATYDAGDEELRHATVLREIEQLQSANFCHFAVLCVVPTILLIIVLAGAFSPSEECISTLPGIMCQEDDRLFIHAFTTRCVCTSITEL